MQDVNYQLFSDSVREELLIGLDETDADVEARANQVMADLDLTAFAEGGLLSRLHFQYANDLHTLVSTDEATGAETLRNPRWYATMCTNEGTAEDRCAIIRALHHLQ